MPDKKDRKKSYSSTRAFQSIPFQNPWGSSLSMTYTAAAAVIVAGMYFLFLIYDIGSTIVN